MTNEQIHTIFSCRSNNGGTKIVALTQPGDWPHTWFDIEGPAETVKLLRRRTTFSPDVHSHGRWAMRIEFVRDTLY